MSNQDSPSEAQEYDTQSVIYRTEDEAYVLDAWLLSGHTTTATRAYTYGRTEGLYKVSPEDAPEVVAALDAAFESLQEKYGAVDEAQFERIDGDAYEVLVKVVPGAEAAPYDSEFNHNTSVVHVSPENDGAVVEALDEAFDALGSVVADDS
jgi:hypothetical protein